MWKARGRQESRGKVIGFVSSDIHVDSKEKTLRKNSTMLFGGMGHECLTDFFEYS
jgi:hypothetical protein